MKQYYPQPLRHGILFVMLLFFLFSHTTFSQSSESIIPGVFRIKVSEELASQLEQLRDTRDINNVILTGIASIDAINRQYKVSGIKRVFRPAGKFEAKHRKYGLHRWYEIEMDKAASVLQALSAYDEISSVEKAEPVYKKAVIGQPGPRSSSPVSTALSGSHQQTSLATLPGSSNDPLLPSQWHYNNTGQTAGTPGADIRLLQAWGIETGTSNVIVAVTDGGIQVDHPDLVANMWVNTSEIPGNNIDDDNNGYVDDINGYGFGDDTGFIAPDAHGTHVGGTIAATTNNGIGVAGVAGGSGIGDGARLMSCAAFGANDNGGFAETYTYAADNGAVISQNSWGYLNPGAVEEAVLDGIDYFIAEAGKDEFGNQVGPMNGGIVIFAAGNDDTNDEWYPGFYEATLAVAATTHEDLKAYYSNYGPWVDISAPGGETINVTQQGILSTLTPGAYGFFQGTSMACPHVSGAAALIVSRYGGPGFSPDVLRARLVQTADPIDHLNPEYAGMLGSGRLNAFAALQEDDDTPPEAIALNASNNGMTEVVLTWIAPADSGNGSATFYDIRYSTSPISEGNFDDATAVANPPAPQPAGSAESYTVSGLAPGTTYYFAIKSADFFGNESAISNVVSVTTEFPPKIVVGPTALNETLSVGETSELFFAIFNTGAGPLSFSIANQADWAVPSPASGTIAPGDSVFIGVTFSAIDLPWDITYTQNLLVLSNDPTSDSVVAVHVTLAVTPNGAPIISVDPDSLAFGNVFIGDSVGKQITIHNGGSELLTVMAALNEGDFSTDFPGNFPADTIGIPPFGEFTFNVTYTPTSVGAVSDALMLLTNDPVDSIVMIPLAGAGVEAPAIDVSPDSLFASLNTGNTTTQLLTISNEGGSDLEFSINVSAPVSGVASVTEIELTPKSAATESSSRLNKQTVPASSRMTQKITLRSMGTTATAVKVLILTPDADVTDLATMLNGFGDVEATVFPGSLLPGITLGDITGYDVVMTTNNTQWLQAGNVSPEVIGDLLADYIDQGGKVIVNSFVYSYDAWKLEGRFIDEQYGPFTPSTTDANITTSLGSILAPGHPVMQGVSTLQYSGFIQNVGLVAGATALANWANGDLFIAANNNVVALNLLPSLGDGGPFQWSGDLPTIYQNAIHWLSGPSFVSAEPQQGTIAPGSEAVIEVTFDATGMESGFYTASVDITSNVPGNELVSVPAYLQVLGPEFTVEPDSIVAEVEKGETTTRTLILSNNGTGDHPFSITTKVSNVAQAAAPEVSVSQPRPLEASRRTLVSGEKKTNARIPAGSLDATAALENPQGGLKRMSFAPLATATVYATDFEGFANGDITDQEGWFGQFGNWTIENANPYGGNNHFRGLSDGLGRSLAFSPNVGIGSESKSTVSMAIDPAGSGVTWQIIPQSPAAGSVVTRIQFSPGGGVQALVSDGAGGGAFTAIPASVPSGYFNLTIEADRATSAFAVYFDGVEVFAGQGFTGDIEEVAILSEMEVAGPTLDIDDFELIDGVKEFSVPFINVSPTSGNLAAGQSIEINVTFDATELEFGDYFADVIIDIAGVEQLVVPAQLTVVGDRAIEVSPTVVQTVVPYKEDTVEHFQIRNTGGRPLDYSMTVIGADIVVNSAPAVQKSAGKEVDKRILQKIDDDERRSSNSLKQISSLEVLTGTALFEEHFEGSSFPPAGWSVVDNEGSGVVWDFAAGYGEGNYAGSGEAATVSSDAAGAVEFDTELLTPVINISGYKNVALQFNANYQNFANLDFLELDIRVAGQSTWENVLTWNEDHGTLFGTGASVTVELDDYLGDATSFQLRWHYYDPNTGDWDWYAQVDDIVIMGDANRWLTVSPASGTVPVGSVADIEAHFDAEDVEAGFYVAGILVGSNAANTPLVGVVASMQVLQPAVIDVQPDSLYQELMIGESASQSITISNSGPSPLRFSIEAAEAMAATAQSGERRVPLVTRTSPVMNTLRLDDRSAIRSGNIAKTASVVQYSTTFEEFQEGDISGQHGWSAQFGNWTVESDNPFSGARHFRGLADGLGQSLAFSPEVTIGSEPISSTTMMINADNAIGSTWHIIPQSVTAELVNTRFAIAPDGSLSALVTDSLGNAFFANVPATLPSGYFEFKIAVERATSIFTLYFNGSAVFTGQGFAGDIEQVVVFSLMENAGPVLDIEDLSIFDGEPAMDWAVVNPESGVVPPGGTMEVEVTFNAEELEEGVYRRILSVRNNDPNNPVVSVSLTLNAMDNDAPVLSPVNPVEITETQSAEITFVATDEDDSVVTVTLAGYPDFVSLAGSANGTATYAISPSLGDAGEYQMQVIAQDERGEMDSATFILTVIPYGVESFSLINAETGDVFFHFKDSVTIDIANPDFLKYAIRANTAPAEVGSIQFRVDGKKTNLEKDSPYLLSRLVLPLLSKGEHILKAESFVNSKGKGEKGASATAIINITNSAAVTGFEVVTTRGNFLMELQDGSVINIRESGYGSITVLANTNGASCISSVKFELNGKHFYTASLSPYSMTAGLFGLYLPWKAKPGHYVLKATPYSLPLGLGVAGESFTVTFDVVRGNSSVFAKGGSNAREASEENSSEENVITSSGEGTLVISPNPVADKMSISFKGDQQGEVELVIFSIQGQLLYRGKVAAGDVGNNFEFNTSMLNMTDGVYYLQLITPDGKRLSEKFIKE